MLKLLLLVGLTVLPINAYATTDPIDEVCSEIWHELTYAQHEGFITLSESEIQKVYQRCMRSK